MTGGTRHGRVRSRIDDRTRYTPRRVLLFHLRCGRRGRRALATKGDPLQRRASSPSSTTCVSRGDEALLEHRGCRRSQSLGYTAYGIVQVAVAWTVETLKNTVDEELEALLVDLRARFVRTAQLVEAVGLPNVGESHVTYLGEAIWEIRLKGKRGIAPPVCHREASARGCLARLREEDAENSAARAPVGP